MSGCASARPTVASGLSSVGHARTPGAFLFGLRLMAVDGTTEMVPDTPENALFGYDVGHVFALVASALCAVLPSDLPFIALDTLFELGRLGLQYGDKAQHKIQDRPQFLVGVVCTHLP